MGPGPIIKLTELEVADLHVLLFELLADFVGWQRVADRL